MTPSGIKALANLINTEDKEINQYPGMDTIEDKEIDKILKELKAKEKAERIQAAAEEIFEINKKCDGAINGHVFNIRKYQAFIKDAQKTIDDIQLARAYGNETKNYGPLLNMIGLLSEKQVIDMGFSVSKVPKGFTPKQPIKKLEIK